MIRIKRLLLLPALLLLLNACGLNTNVMYNAKNYFKSAKERPLNANGKPTPQAVAEYTKAIEKCGIILTEMRNSPKADDALYLMARALYYKGNSAFQAKEQFENLIKAFPDSPFVPEAHIYLARVHRDINRAAEAEKLLEEFLRDPKYKKHHPRALLVLSDFEILDKDYYRAQYWLEKLLTEYPDTPEYNEAFFLFGKNYYVQKDYANSRIQYEKLIGSRGVSKEIKLEANYYIALNLLYLKEYPKGYRIVRSQINSEYRTDKLALARVLKARYQLAMDNEKDAKSELDYIQKTYPRSAASAESFYYLAEYLFYQNNNIADAITNYNRVRTELATSELVTIAQQKSAALTQLNQGKNLNSEANLQQFLDYHFVAADNYYNPLELPDSTLALYRKILQEKDRFISRKDSLLLQIDSLDVILDSLGVETETSSPLDSVETIQEDKELSEEEKEIIAPENKESSTEPKAAEEKELTEEEKADYVAAEKDEIDLPKLDLESGYPDAAEADSTIIMDPNLQKAALRDSLQTQRSTIISRIETLDTNLSRYEEEIVPFTWFVQASFYKSALKSDAMVDSIRYYLEQNYPDSKFSTAVNQLSRNETIRLIDRNQEAKEQKLDLALSQAVSQPDSMLVALNELSECDLPSIAMRAKFRLAWYYTFEADDTTAAKTYLDAVLADQNSGDYGILIRRFWDGSKFLFSKYTPPADTLANLSDSLMVTDSLAVADSLGNDMDTDEQETDPPVELQEKEIETENPPLDAEPEKDAPLPDPLPENIVPTTPPPPPETLDPPPDLHTE